MLKINLKQLEKLTKYFKDVEDKAENYKDSKEIIEATLKSGKLDEQTTTGVIPFVAVTRKIKDVKFIEQPKLPKSPKLPNLPSKQQQAKYTNPNSQAAFKKLEKSKKSFNKKVAKTFSKWLVVPKEEFKDVDF